MNGAQRGPNYLCSTGDWEDGDALAKACASKVNAAGKQPQPGQQSSVGHHCATTPAKKCSAVGLGWDASQIMPAYSSDPVKARFTLPVHVRLRTHRSDEAGYVSMSVPLKLMREGEVSSGENSVRQHGTSRDMGQRRGTETWDRDVGDIDRDSVCVCVDAA